MYFLPNRFSKKFDNIPEKDTRIYTDVVYSDDNVVGY